MAQPTESPVPAEVVRPRWWEPVLIFIVASLGLCAVIFFYDNVHRGTTNGLWKSMDVRLWTDWLPERFTDGDNLLYYPVVGVLVRLLPADLFGTFWQRMAFVNAFIGAAVLALTYLIALRLFRSRATALFACACQFAMAFFLLLSTINEDIMPGYAWFVAAVACAVTAPRLTPWVIVLTAQFVALSWLFHSSLRLPGIAAFVLAIAATEESWRQRIRSVALFVAALIPLPIVSALAFGLSWWSGVWSFKGFGTTWGGFALNKFTLMAGGVSQSVAGGYNLASVEQIVTPPLRLPIALTTIFVVVLFGVWLVHGWRRRGAPEWRMAATVLGAAFVLGEMMNLYIQPQDPQMQIQPMTWFPFAAACVFAAVGHFGRLGVALRVAFVSFAALLVAYNVRAYIPARHSDSAALEAARTLEARVQPERTIFLMHGFEGMSTWLTLLWGRGGEWPGKPLAKPGTRGFHVIYIGGEVSLYPQHSVSEASYLVTSITELALERGFDVIASDLWAAPEAEWIDRFVTISTPEKPLAIRAALNDRFSGTSIGDIPGWGTLYRITLKP